VRSGQWTNSMTVPKTHCQVQPGRSWCKMCRYYQDCARQHAHVWEPMQLLGACTC
jgi:hypothetical protein